MTTYTRMAVVLLGVMVISQLIMLPAVPTVVAMVWGALLGGFGGNVYRWVSAPDREGTQ